MTRIHKIMIGVVALVVISLTAVFALNNNGRSPTTTKVPTKGGAGGLTCSCCNHHGYLEAYQKAIAAEDSPKETDCLCGEDCGFCDACKGGERCECENCKCDQCGKKTDCCCGDDCKCCEGCKGGDCTCDDCQCCGCCNKK